MKQTAQLTWAGQHFVLYRERAAFWKEHSALLIADPHFGKTAAFRAAGIPIPPGTTDANIARLEGLIVKTRAQRLIILGDFFHHASGRFESLLYALTAWRKRNRLLEVTLVRGNHDLHAGDPPSEWKFHVVQDPFEFGAIRLCHKPCQDRKVISIAGHIHPSVNLTDQTGHSLGLPCFLFGARQALFPAFGEFTGNASVRPRLGDRVFVLGEHEIIEIPA